MSLSKLAFIITIASILKFSSTFAQPSFTTSDKETAAKISKSTLAVVMKSKDEKLLNKLKNKPDKLKAYEESVDAFNAYLKQAVEKEWNLSAQVKFITEQEADALKESKDPAHFLLEITDIKNYKMGDFYMPNNANGNYTGANIANKARDQAYHFSSSGKSVALSISPASRPNKELVFSYLPLAGISQGTVTFMALHLKNQIVDCLKGITGVSDLKKDVAKRNSKLKDKTLLIFEPLISNGLQKTIDKKQVSENYPYKYEVVSFEKVEEVIVNKDSKFAYIWVVPAGAVVNGGQVYNYFIIDGEDGRALFMTGRGYDAFGGFHQGHLRMANKGID